MQSLRQKSSKCCKEVLTIEVDSKTPTDLMEKRDWWPDFFCWMSDMDQILKIILIKNEGEREEKSTSFNLSFWKDISIWK